MFASTQIETDFRKRGHSVVVGVDEVGRGALAGPLVSAAVILPTDCDLRLRDSKKLSPKQRAELFDEILACCDGFGIGLASAAEIDSLGLSQALRLSQWRALEMLELPFSLVILDGSYNVIGEDFVNCIVKADEKVACVAAASIVAKVYRDELMRGAALVWPRYGFESHVGYGSLAHRQAITKHGKCPLHRRSFKVKSL